MSIERGIQQNKLTIRPVVYGLGLYFFVSGTDSFVIGSIGSFLKLISFIPLILSVLDIRSWNLRISPTFVLQFLFWLLSVTSIIYSINADKSFASVKSLTLNLAMVCCLGVMEEYNTRELQFLQRSLFASGWFMILMMLLFSDISANGRLTLLLGTHNQDQNYINGYYIYTFSCHCDQMLSKKKKIHIIPTFYILYIVLRTGSRGAMIAYLLIFVMHICILFEHSKYKIRNILLVASILFASIIIIDFIMTRLPEEVARRYSMNYIAEKGTTGRTRTWRFLLRHYSEDNILRILFGHGYGSAALVNTLNGRVPHNLYLDNLITLGIFGMILQLAIQGTVAWIFIKHRKRAFLCAYGGMIGMCLSLSLVTYKPIWNIMLLALAIDANEDSKT